MTLQERLQTDVRYRPPLVMEDSLGDIRVLNKRVIVSVPEPNKEDDRLLEFDAMGAKIKESMDAFVQGDLYGANDVLSTCTSVGGTVTAITISNSIHAEAIVLGSRIPKEPRLDASFDVDFGSTVEKMDWGELHSK